MDLAQTVQKHDDDLYRGNGKPGLTTRMAVCEERIDDVKESFDKLMAHQSRMTWLALGTLLTVLGDILVNLVKH